MKRVRELEGHAIGVVVPSRDRPEDVIRLHQSMLSTSTDACLLLYVDSDQEALYRQVMELPRVYTHVGTRQGPVASANLLCDRFRGSVRIYGMVADDSELLTPGWDKYLIQAVDAFPERIGVVSAAHNGGLYVNYAWVSREWIETVGWYFYPNNFHHCCDTVLEMLGEATKIEYSPPERFQIRHDLKHTMNRDQVDHDLAGFLQWCVGERRELVRRIRERQGRHETAVT